MSGPHDEISPNDIAIVGMAMRVPGASTVDAFWSNLVNGVESIRPLTAGEVAAAALAGDPVDDRRYVQRTADLPEMEMFDPDFFGLSPKEAAIMDPQHRHFLECAWEALEDAGRMPDREVDPVGVFAASGMGSYFYFNVCSNRELVEQTGMFLLRHTGNDKDFLSTRVSFSFDLRGPSVNVQTACSSSLVAVHYAAQSLMNGECGMALAGGVTIEQPHRRGYVYQDGEILSPEGHCRAFDHRAAGTVFGSGVGIVVLRRLSDAIADGDTIHAVIKGSAINNDGASKAGYLAPSVTGQAEAIIEAQGIANIAADSIGYVECHGTGTYLGDPIEIEALTEAFRLSTDKRNYCRIGSVKSNIGHLDTAAGVVSLIKASLAVKHGVIPPTLGYEKPNPAINFAASPFVVNDKLADWPASARLRRAGVNSLGVGGTNAHVIVEQPPARKATPANDDDVHLLVLSAKSRKAVEAAQAHLGAAIAANPDLALADVAHTLVAGRRSFEHRAAVAVRGRADAIAALTQPELKRAMGHAFVENSSGAVFLFPGGGAQHHGMARSLYANDPHFRSIVDEGLGYLPATAAAELRASWLDATVPDPRLALPSVQLPAILIVEIAIARLWLARGINPVALVGHSMGENAAACIAGVMSFSDAVNLVRVRGELFETLEKGGMLSVSMAAEQLRAILPAELDMASVNAPGLCVVSGLPADLDRFAAVLRDRGIDATPIAIDVAAHSRMLEAILPRFRAFVATLSLRAPKIPIISNVTGAPLSAADATSADYWTRHLRSTVLFEACLAALSEDKGRIFIEVGPSRGLSSLAKAQGNIDANRVINSLPHPDEAVDEQLYVTTAFGRAWAVGLPVKVEAPFGQRVSLPTYPFQHRKYFFERQQEAARQDAPLLKLADMLDWGYRPAWKRSVPDTIAGADSVPKTWLLFADDGDTGQQLATRLRDAGHRVIVVASGDGFIRRGPDDYVLAPEHGREGYDRLVASLTADAALPMRVIYLPLLTHRAAFRPGSSYFDRIQQNGFYGLLHLAQALADAGASDALGITVVTNGAQQVDGEGLTQPEKATIEGPALVIPRELSGATVRLVDVDLPIAAANTPKSLIAALKGRTVSATTPSAMLEHLLEEVLATPASEIVAWRGSRRWSRIHQPLKLAPATDQAPAFRQGGVYLLTGGLGDLALTFAEQLVDTYGARIILMARTTLPPEGEWPLLERVLPRADKRYRAIAAISAMRARGGEVLVVRGDVGNPADVQAALEQAKSRFGMVNGVLHTAGIVDDAPLATKTDDSAESVLAPKVQGTLVLAKALADEPLDLLVLFSSTSTDTAPAGQVDYVGANAFLNAFAENQSARADRRTVAVHWGIWNGVGMAARNLATDDDSAASRVLGSAKGPFFHRWVEDADGTRWLEAEVDARSCWLFDEHRLASGQALMPGTGYIELITQAMREAEMPSMAIEDLEFERPMFIADNEHRLVRLRFELHGERYRVVIASGSTPDKMQIHAEASLTAAPSLPLDRGAEIAAAQARSTLRSDTAGTGASLSSAQETHLRFGPRWRVLRSLAIGRDDAVATLALPPAFQSDLAAGYQAHPGLLDIATGFAMELVPGYADSDVLWAPASYGRIVQVQPLPADVISWVRLADSTTFGDDYAAFDVVITDPEGNLILTVDRLLLKRLSGDGGFGTAPQAHGRERPQSAGLRQLAAQMRQGILPDQALEALERALATKVAQPIVSSMDLPRLIERAEKLAEGPGKNDQLFERPADLESDYVAPRDAVETRLAEFWRELLGIGQVGIEDNFFDIGGHSLVAVRLFRSIRQAYGVDLPISTLFEAPTIAQLARKLPTAEGGDETGPADAMPADQPIHRVAMHIAPNANATPLFICAGMFGNILNLRQLARQLGQDRSVYGLQARGLYGEVAPHETFEEMAASCLAEVRAVQPAGPYMLAGFSGGGLVAYEMAQQLRREGETVSHLIMLDTPLPTQPGLTTADLISMRLQDIRREGISFFSNWIAGKLMWRRELQRRLLSEAAGVAGTGRYNNDAIEAAFNRALPRYVVKPYDGDVTLFRPQPEVEYRLSDGRILQPGRKFFYEDNGWSHYTPNLTVVEVPGDHNSMVLDPSVRILAADARKVLNKATAQGNER
ncbi:polyketide synthase [Devosia limi DSM 17137]|uniref:Acyl transferase domain-containing protein n=1 Tax=Devosia limi DSM 17137 TaxID=1121477 RepID=A0A0F5LE66_9HYPH|nr:type I polyketide synthase [Devosia limi]KKB80638.1 polyketide synthase [Devosia limi DSM 17137]SHE49998.1 Acyl transferase domain-containing protein [Devosia limi DSM 17137]